MSEMDTLSYAHFLAFFLGVPTTVYRFHDWIQPWIDWEVWIKQQLHVQQKQVHAKCCWMACSSHAKT